MVGLLVALQARKVTSERKKLPREMERMGCRKRLKPIFYFKRGIGEYPVDKGRKRCEVRGREGERGSRKSSITIDKKPNYRDRE
jgi:hypothetical protein